MELPSVSGIHHVTAICRDAQVNLDFYAGLLGLRLVKLTVNFDDPGAYHLYYGDGIGTPGTILTYFPYPHGRGYEPGNGQFDHTALAVPPGSLDAWEARFANHGVSTIRTMSAFGETALEFGDPDGMGFALVEVDGEPQIGWEGRTIPPGMAIRGVHSVTLASQASASLHFVSERLGLTEVGKEDGVVRFTVGSGFIDVCQMDVDGHGGVGGIHHVALATSSAEEQLHWRSSLVQHGANVSAVMDRDYFRSIYFREPRGSLFEIATIEPGFAVDEASEALGSQLCLPAPFEERRELITASLPQIRLPNGTLIGGE